MERASSIVPAQFDGSVGTLLVAVAVALVIVQCKGSIGTRIHVDGERQVRLRCTVLRHLRSRHQRATTHEERQSVQRCIRHYPLSACVHLASPEVHPCGSTIRSHRQVYATRGSTRLCHGAHQHASKHIFILDVQRLRVGSKVKCQHARHGIVAKGLHRRQRVSIRSQSIAQVNHVDDSIVVRRTRLTEVPRLTLRVRAMATQHRQEGSPLQHTSIQFAIGRVCIALRVLTLVEPSSVAAGKEATHIHCPVRVTCRHIVESSRYLTLE